MNVKVYVEGGGDTNALKTRCRQGFSEFFRKAGLEGSMPRIVASGSRQHAYDDFCTALNKACESDFIVLLVDSEAAVAAGTGPWTHLNTRDKWDKPAAATDENAHLMVQCMEAWFLADKSTVAKYFGGCFHGNSLPPNPAIEEVHKVDVMAGLEKATHPCKQAKGQYGKGKHSFDVLALIDPAKVVAASPYAKRLIDTLKEKS